MVPAMSRLSATTRLIALLGSPVSHSRSPLMQNGVFEYMGLNYAYLAFDIQPPQLADAIAGVRAMNIRGCNVTMPLKRDVCQFLDHLTPAAELAGAVNVIVNDHGVLTGHISDGEGYMMSLCDAGVDYVGKKITLAGTGGAATAVAIQAAMEGVRCIRLFNHRDGFFEQGQTLARLLCERFDCDASLHDLADLDSLKAEMANSDLFINGTPVGMEHSLHQSVIPDASYFHPQLVVSDLIYVPARTRLLRMAEAASLKTVSGLGMQLFQATSAFRMWTGYDMPVDVARRCLLAS